MTYDELLEIVQESVERVFEDSYAYDTDFEKLVVEAVTADVWDYLQDYGLADDEEEGEEDYDDLSDEDVAEEEK